MSTHTAGPWTLTIGKFFYVHGVDAEGKRVYITQRDSRHKSEIDKARIEADARLIASAPELLEALIDCRLALEIANFTQELAVVDAAISKATRSAA